jgi:hypothetical protein
VGKEKRRKSVIAGSAYYLSISMKVAVISQRKSARRRRRKITKERAGKCEKCGQLK